jgi:hypothetical protein
MFPLLITFPFDVPEARELPPGFAGRDAGPINPSG